MTYAKIENGVIANMIEIAHNAAEFPDCVPVYDRPVQIGDTYADGVFRRDGKVVKNAMEMLADAIAEKQEAMAALSILMEGEE